MLIFVSAYKPLSLYSIFLQGTGLTEHHSQHDSPIVDTVALVITGERAHSCKVSTGIFDTPNRCIGQEPVLSCAKSTGVVDKHVLLGWGREILLENHFLERSFEYDRGDRSPQSGRLSRKGRERVELDPMPLIFVGGRSAGERFSSFE